MPMSASAPAHMMHGSQVTYSWHLGGGVAGAQEAMRRCLLFIYLFIVTCTAVMHSWHLGCRAEIGGCTSRSCRHTGAACRLPLHAGGVQLAPEAAGPWPLGSARLPCRAHSDTLPVCVTQSCSPPVELCFGGVAPTCCQDLVYCLELGVCGALVRQRQAGARGCQCQRAVAAAVVG